MKFFTADTHFWHRNVINYCQRPWKTIEEMNQGIIDNWNSVVTSGDEVYILGDVAFCGTKKLVEIMSQLNGRKHLIIGNHDRQNINIKNGLNMGFASVNDYMLMDLPIIGLTLLNHFPYLHGDTDQRGKLRHLEYRPEDEGLWLFHGHIHNGLGSWRVKNGMVNVGVDVWDYKPVSIDKIIYSIDQFIRNGYDDNNYMATNKEVQ